MTSLQKRPLEDAEDPPTKYPRLNENKADEATENKATENKATQNKDTKPEPKRQKRKIRANKTKCNFSDQKMTEYVKDLLQQFSATLKERNVDLLSRKVTKETDVGISVYLSTLMKTNEVDANIKINGITKHCWYDFVVREVNNSKEIAPLCPTVEEKNEEVNEKEEEEKEKEQEKEQEKEIISILGEAAFNEMCEFAKEAHGQKNKGVTKTLDVTLSKIERRQVHEYLNKKYPTLDHQTDNDGMIVMTQALNKRRRKADGKCLKFVLVKKQMDTTSCLNLLAKKLGFRDRASRAFEIAGLKDKRALSSQWVTAFRLSPERLKHAAVQGIVVGNFETIEVNSMLRLGRLYGNNFQVVIRNVVCNTKNVDVLSVLKKRFELLKTHGFINYFGMQRFGTSVVSTHELGRCVLAKDWEMFGALFYCPRNHEHPNVKIARGHFLETGNVYDLSRMLWNECSFLMNLIQMYNANNEHKKAFADAFAKLGTHQKTIFVHSYQSFVWNLCASFRLEKYGPNVCVGDLVKINVPKDKGSLDFLEEEDQESDVKMENNEVAEPMQSEENNFEDGIGEGDEIILVTKENKHKFTIFDVVLPLPCYNAKLPGNDVANYMQELLKKDKLSLGHIDATYLGGKRNLYRYIFAKPENIDMKIQTYSNSNECLLEDVRECKLFDRKEESANKPQSETFLAVILSFTLAKSCYATMAIREFLRAPSTKMKARHP